MTRMRTKFAGADQNIEHAQKASHDIDVAVANLEAKHSEMVSRVRELEQLDRDTKAKNLAAQSLNAAGRLIKGGADVSVDDVQARMRAANDVAEEKFTRALGESAIQEDTETAAAVDSVLNEFRQSKVASSKW